ncbi:C-reactive protein-like isoform X2 [Mixophyes fleayi]
MDTMMILLILASLSGILSQTDMACKSFIFSKDYSFPAQLIHNGDGPYSRFTVCLRSCTHLTESAMFSLLSGLQYDYLFLILGGGSDTNTGLIWVEGQRVDVNFPSNDMLEWRSICLSWDSPNGEMLLWVNGEMTKRRELLKRGMTYVNPRTFIGPGQIFLGGKPKLDVGEITDVHVWDSVLTSQDVKDFHNKKEKVGNIINWRALNYDGAAEDFTIGPFQCKLNSTVTS